MKIRTDFVTNSSSSSFTLEIGFKLINGEEIIFKGEGATGETGPTDYFDEEAIMTVSPRQLGLAKNLEELIKLLQEGVLSGDRFDIKYGNFKNAKKIFEKSEPREGFAPETYDEITVDAYDFIKDIKSKVNTIEDIESITVTGDEENYYTWTRIFKYDLKNKKYTLEEFGEDPVEREDSAGGDLIFEDQDLAERIEEEE